MLQAGDCFRFGTCNDRLCLIEDIRENNLFSLKHILKEGRHSYTIISHIVPIRHILKKGKSNYVILNKIVGDYCFQNVKKVDNSIFLKIEKLIRLNFSICNAIVSQATKVPSDGCEICIINSHIFATYNDERIILGDINLKIQPNHYPYKPTINKDTYFKIQEITSNTIKSIEELWDTTKTS